MLYIKKGSTCRGIPRWFLLWVRPDGKTQFVAAETSYSGIRGHLSEYRRHGQDPMTLDMWCVGTGERWIEVGYRIGY